jgi:hypothetical protein
METQRLRIWPKSLGRPEAAISLHDGAELIETLVGRC